MDSQSSRQEQEHYTCSIQLPVKGSKVQPRGWGAWRACASAFVREHGFDAPAACGLVLEKRQWQLPVLTVVMTGIVRNDQELWLGVWRVQ
jgi:hypothetical protein